MEAILIYIAIIIILGYIGHLLKKRFPKFCDFMAGSEAETKEKLRNSYDDSENEYSSGSPDHAPFRGYGYGYGYDTPWNNPVKLEDEERED